VERLSDGNLYEIRRAEVTGKEEGSMNRRNAERKDIMI
jgi:hypothetical protein